MVCMRSDATCPASELKERRQKLREILVSKDCHFAWITHQPDVFYFSGTAQNAHLIVPRDSGSILYVRKYLPRARLETDIKRIQPFNSPSDIANNFNYNETLSYGIEMDVLPLKLFKKMESSLPSAKWEDISLPIRQLRSAKSLWEVQMIQQSCRLLDRIFDRIGAWLKKGMTELELASRIEYECRLAGHQGTIPVRAYNSAIHFGAVLFGANAAVRGAFDGPVSGPGLYRAAPKGAGWKQLEAGEPVFVDLVSGISGYIADATRVYCLGDLPDSLAEAHSACLDIQKTVVENLKAGMPCSRPYEIATNHVSDIGLANVFMGPDDDRAGFIAHGVGLELDELPVFAPRFKTLIPEHAVVAMEPKAVFTGIGAVGIENTWHITVTGAERLTHFPDRCCKCAG